MSAAFEIIGDPAPGGILIVADHAANRVPAEIDLGIGDDALKQHIAWDIGVAAVARRMIADRRISGILATYSRLVVDLNRDATEEAVVPLISDGIVIPGNRIDDAERNRRLDAYFHPYHTELARLISEYRPALLLSLHSFTPILGSNPAEQRPWQISVLYNRDERAAKFAIPMFAATGLVVGDQCPYSGKDLNATMNRHGEGTDTAYLGIEMRQDMVSDQPGQARFADILAKVCHKVTEALGAA